jgi:hypothetical protein
MDDTLALKNQGREPAVSPLANSTQRPRGLNLLAKGNPRQGEGVHS